MCVPHVTLLGKLLGDLKISTRVQYSVIAACIRGKYVIFVGATSFLAYIGARNLTDLGTPWEVSTLSINFYKFNNRRSQVTFFCMITFLSICVVHNFELFWVNFRVDRMNFYRSWFLEKKRSMFALLNIDCKFFCPGTLNSFLESYSWSSIYCTTTAKLIDLTVNVVPPKN